MFVYRYKFVFVLQYTALNTRWGISCWPWTKRWWQLTAWQKWWM